MVVVAGLLLAVLAVLGGLLAGCGSSPGGGPVAAKTVDLAMDPGNALPNRTEQVTVQAGQTLAVRYKHTDSPGYWNQTAGGDTTVLSRNGDSSVSDCTTEKVGCGSTEQQFYLARARGSSTIVWTFQGVGPGFRAPSAQPTIACPGAEVTQPGDTPPRCPIGVIRIQVTVS